MSLQNESILRAFKKKNERTVEKLQRGWEKLSELTKKEQGHVRYYNIGNEREFIENSI